MAATTSTSSVPESKLDLTVQIKRHEVTIQELSSCQAAYQKNGNIFFRTSIEKVTTSEQNKLDLAKAKLKKLEEEELKKLEEEAKAKLKKLDSQ